MRSSEKVLLKPTVLFHSMMSRNNAMFLMSIVCAIMVLNCCHGFVIQKETAVWPSWRYPHLSQRTTTTSSTSSIQRRLFGGIFGSDDDDDDTKSNDKLALYPKLASSDLKFDSLVDYVQQWGKLLEGKGMGLTTPVTIRAVNNVIDKSDNDIVRASGVKILFLKVETGYKDKDEKEEDDDYDKKKKAAKKEKEVKQGGVEILVEQLNDDSVQIRARRCEMDDDTMIKEMSEKTILKKLKKMVDVWKKEQ